MYENYIDINKKFKASVNLSYDLLNEEKIEQYIPTSNLCDVIKKYLKAFVGTPNFKSTTLSGPYGKGKSYLLLMIVYFLSQHDNRKLFDKVCAKIKTIDEELYNLIIEIDNSNKYLLPVIINNNSYPDLNKNFIAALVNSLNTYGFKNVVPNTTYNEAIVIIEKWREESKNNSGFDILDLCLQKLNISLDDLQKGLELYEDSYFEKFTELYTCVSHGLEFFSMKSDDFVTIYNEVCDKVTRLDSNCQGLFVIFDEFGSFLNNQSSDFVTKLGRIQAFAEKCNESDALKQMHFCCITHKDILLYKKDKSYNDAFDTIAGRFDTIRFDRTLDENYQIICSALVKKDGYKDKVLDFKNEYGDVLENIKNSGIFTTEQFNYVVNNGYPFNPITLYTLIQVSEKIAQNERTLFTFLSDTDIDGFRYFISNNDKGLLNVESIYNYFSSLLRENDEYKILFYKVQSLIKNSVKNEEHNIFKAIALIKIINDPLKFNCTLDNISMSLGLSSDSCKQIVNNLIEKKVLKKNINDDSIDFSIIADKQINKIISDTAQIRFSDLDIGKTLSMFDKNRYEISNEYNFKHKMVRYYRTIYLEASKIILLKDFNEILYSEIDNEFCDGLIINLVNDLKLNKEQIKEMLDKSNGNIIVRYVSDNIHKVLISKLKELSAAKYLYEGKNLLSDNAVKTLPLLIEDMTEEVSTYLYDFYSKARVLNKYNYREKNLNKIINLSFENFYPSTVAFNNEQVNKNDVPSVTIKARNNVIDCILLQEKIDFGKTSQEATIYNSFNNTIKEQVLNIIKDIIVNSNGDKICFSNIVGVLKKEPFGMRNGIIPLFVAQSIAELSIITEDNVDTIIMYNNNVEIDVNSSNLTKACTNPENYYFCYTQVNNEKINMTYKLMELFDCKKSSVFAENIRALNQKMKSYVSNLSPVIIKTNVKDNLLNLNSVAINFKDAYLKLNTNNYELLFNNLPNIFNCEYIKVYDKVDEIKGLYSSKIEYLYNDVIIKTKNLFGFNDGSLKSGIDIWMKKYSYIDNIVFENIHKNIYNSLKEISFNDDDAINMISFGCVNCAVDDYNIKKYNDYFENLKSFVEKVSNYNSETSTGKDTFEQDDNEIKLSSLAKTLYTNILESVEEYGDAVSNEEKALVYKKLLKDLLG